MEKLVSLLKDKNMTIASCESLTGGLFASSIVNVSGASNVFKGSFVTYQDEAKAILLNGNDILKTKGAISKEMAFLMASKVKETLKSNIAVSFTGNAGPNKSENKDVGLVYICIIINDSINHYKLNLNGNRDSIRNQCVDFAKQEIIKLLGN